MIYSSNNKKLSCPQITRIFITITRVYHIIISIYFDKFERVSDRYEYDYEKSKR